MKIISLMLLVLIATPLFAKSKSKEIPESFLSDLKHELKLPSSYGCWSASGEPQNLEAGAALSFNKELLDENTILGAKGEFTFPSKGIYQVSLSITTQGRPHQFELELAGKSAGKMTTALEANYDYAYGSMTILVNAKAKDTLRIVNKSGARAVVSSGDASMNAATLTIVQIPG